MAVPLFVGGEDIDFNSAGGTLAVITTAGRFRATHARCALQVTSSGNVDIGYLTKPWTSAPSEFWAHARCYHTTGLNSATTMQFFALRNGANTKLYVAPSDATGSPGLTLYKRNNAGTSTLLKAGVGATLTTSAESVLDVYTKYQSSGGQVKVYLNEVLIIDYTGDVTTDGDTTLDKLVLGTTRAGAGTPSVTAWSECLVQAEDTRTRNVHTLTPSANGNTYTFAAGSYADVDETTLNDGDITSSPTAAQLGQYALNTSLLAGNPAVLAVVLSARAMRGATGPTQLEPNVRTGGTDYYAAGMTQPTAFDRVAYAWENNPATGVAWLASAITTSGFNLGFRSAT